MKKAAIVTTILYMIGYIIAIIATDGEAAPLFLWVIIDIIALVKLNKNEKSVGFGIFFLIFGCFLGGIFYLAWDPDSSTSSIRSTSSASHSGHTNLEFSLMNSNLNSNLDSHLNNNTSISAVKRSEQFIELSISRDDAALTLGDLKELLANKSISAEEYSARKSKILGE